MSVLFRSGTGEIGDLSYWQGVLDRFWQPFTASKVCTDMRLPKRPHDAWERFVRVMKLEEIQEV